MKKLTTLFAVVALSSAAVAGPVQKQEMSAQEGVQLAQQQQQSTQTLNVQAGSISDDYGLAIIGALFGVAALTIGLVALND
jgi:hypothetical protein